MNTELIRKVQERIADPANSYNMYVWRECISGHTIAAGQFRFDTRPSIVFDTRPSMVIAAALLDLTHKQANMLFNMRWPLALLRKYTISPQLFDEVCSFFDEGWPTNRAMAIEALDCLMTDPVAFENRLLPTYKAAEVHEEDLVCV